MTTTVPFSSRFQLYVPAAPTTVFNGTFPLFVDTSALKVYVDGVLQLNSTYTITSTFDNGRADLWHVTLDTPVSGVDVWLAAEDKPKRDDDFVDGQPDLVVDADVEIDRGISLHQEWYREFGRTRRLPVGEHATRYILPAPAERAGKVDGYDAFGAPTLINPNFTTTTITNIYDTRSDLAAATVDASVKVARVLGYTTIGDSDEIFYKRVASEPSHEAKVRSQDRFLPSGATDATNGGWWVYYSFVMRPEVVGAIGGGNDTTALQNAEDAALALGLNLWINKTHRISDSILKKSGVNWYGGGAIEHIDYGTQPTLTVTTQFALIFADTVNEWEIDGITFRSIKHETVFAASLPRKNGDSANPGNWNSCIDCEGCTGWIIRNCVFTGFSYGGVKYQDCSAFQVTNCRFSDDSSTTVASIVAGTAPPNYANTFAIGALYEATGPSPFSRRYQITGNRITVPGLDIAISALSQTYDQQPGIISGNYIFGCRAGIQAYRGSFTDPGGAPTYDGNLLIEGNFVHAAFEQGIYIRSVTGVSCRGNLIDECAKVGTNGAGSSAGGIVTRINPFAAYTAGTFGSAGTVSNRFGIDISGNMIRNCGSLTALDGGIQLRVPFARAYDNVIFRDEKVYTTRVGVGIVVENNEEAGGLIAARNRIFNVAFGILGAGSVSRASEHPKIIRDNEIDRVVDGIFADVFSWHGAKIQRNIVRNATTTGIVIRNAPNSVIEQNDLCDCAVGIDIRVGCLASDVVNLMTMGSKNSSTLRYGGTAVVRFNEIKRCATPHRVIETATSDVTFAGRCRIWEGDTADGKRINGREWSHSGTGGSWPPTNTTITWRPHDVARNSDTPTAATIYQRICDVGGTQGSGAISTTCNTTASDPLVTNIASWAGIGPQMYVAIAGTRHYVVSVDPANDRMTVEPAPAGTATGAALTNSGAPTFVDLLAVGAT